MTYVFDIDGTICTLTDGNYEEAIPYQDRIDKINKLYDQENKIIFYTARGMGRYDNDGTRAWSEFYLFTVEQLKNWGVKYHQITLGKPAGDIYIDDKGIKDEEFFTN
tara:strand:- start:429 stop:749 length:321 start_codon:yes stop_codon:yes gene_type:complete